MAAKTGTVTDLANYLAKGYWKTTGGSAHHWDTSSNNIITVNLAGLNEAGKAAARAALDAWEMVADIRFKETTGKADITFDDNKSGATTSVKYDPSNGNMVSATVAIGSSWMAEYGSAVGSYGYQTYVHEIGHALGLGHPGTYNGGASYGSATWKIDSWQMSVMSYLDQDENPNIAAGKAYVVTPMMADIAAIQSMYGAPKGGITAGDTTYGVGSNLDGFMGSVFGSGPGSLSANAMTLYDEGGTDTLNFSDDTKGQRIDLNPGRFSSVYGDRDNVAIASNTIIERAYGGSGSDNISGNAANNILKANVGNDTLSGGSGRDSVYGGDGNDSLYGGVGNDDLRGDSGNDRAEGGDGNDSVYGSGGMDFLYGDDGNDGLYGGDSDDRLDGGVGNDMLTGGSDRDTFLFRRGSDVVTDFQNDVDTIRFDASLWGGDSLSASRILEFATIRDGDAIFNFGNGNVLRVENVTSLSQLSDDIALI